MARLFGTDGVRGIANKDLSAKLALELGWAGASILSVHDHGKILVGRDTRISGQMLESAMVSGIMSTGASAISLGVLPTGAIAFMVKSMKADAGIVISASHNPYEYNGIKFFNSDGFKLSDEDEDRIEVLLRENGSCAGGPIGAHIGNHERSHTAVEEYLAYCTGLVKQSLDGLKLVIDCANGAAYHIAPLLYENLGAQVISIGIEPDGININHDCGSTHPKALQEAVLANNAHLGLAFDGDADRLIAVDETGAVVDGDNMIALCAMHMKESGKLAGDTVVGTVMANLGFDRRMRESNIKVVKTKVGDRYVLEEMLKLDANLGGEQSGHIIFLDDSTTGDGLITSLHILDILISKDLRMSDVSALLERIPQVLINVTVSQKDLLHENDRITKMVKTYEDELGGDGRILVRASGTEPLVRVMVEAVNGNKATDIAETIAAVVEQELG